MSVPATRAGRLVAGLWLLGASSLALATSPTAPQNVQATRTSDSTAYIQWDRSEDDTGIRGYSVYRTDVVKGERMISRVVNPRLADIQLAAEVDYTYTIVAHDLDNNESERSTPVTAAALGDQTGGDPEPPPDTVPPVTGPTNAGGDPEPEPPTAPTTPEPTTPAPGTPPDPDTPEEPTTPAPTPAPPTDPGAPTEPGPGPVDDDGAEPQVPEIDFTAAPVPSPNPDDPFGALLETDPEAPAGGIPTTPKNLRIDLVSNDWSEFSWAPSNDDGEVVAYNIYRSDGTVYTVGRDQSHPNAGVQAELDKYWRNTAFIDCNYTRFFDLIHNCQENGPSPGETFSYQVSAVDDAGNESGLSNPITIVYHLPSNAPIPLYNDIYKAPEDIFAQTHDLSRPQFFLDEFELVFEDQFAGPTLDATRWQTELTWGDERIINREQQYFVDTQKDDITDYDPFRFRQGPDGESLLSIEAVRTPDSVRAALPETCAEVDDEGRENCLFLSGALSSHDLFGITYGYVEGRMKVSGTSGALSSFYLYHRYPGTGILRHAPEIDIIEYLGENPFGSEDAFQTYHFADPNTGDIRSAPTMAYRKPEGDRYDEGYHTFSVLWEPQLVIWYIDGREIKRMTGPQVARQQMNIVAYLVTGSGWAPTPDLTSTEPLRMDIDYIRAYQRAPYTGNGVYPTMP